jgi:hypothetical protein
MVALVQAAPDSPGTQRPLQCLRVNWCCAQAWLLAGHSRCVLAGRSREQAVEGPCT